MVLAFHLGCLPGGSLGVDVFFVLSGFLITTLLVEEWQQRGSISLPQFYLRRALRLLPAFLSLLLVYGVVNWLLLPPEQFADILREIAVAGCYVANWPQLHGVAMGALGHTWSLSVEEQFYLLWPALLLLMFSLRLARKRIILLVCIGIAASAVARAALYHGYGGHGPEKTANVLRLYVGLHSRADSLLVGVLTSLLVTWQMLPRSQRCLFWLRIASIVAVAGLAYLAVFRTLTHSQYYHGLFTVAAVLVAAIIVRMLMAPGGLGGRLLESAPLVGVGRISYGLYLVHSPVLYWLQPEGVGWRHPGNVLMALGLSLAAALASYYVVERPCLRLKDRLQQHSHSAPTAVRAAA
jgi:peptidoglycan/LPS O-acetylase OafA/YrhL